MDGSCESIFQKINPFIKEMMKENDSLPFTWVEIIEAKINTNYCVRSIRQKIYQEGK